MPLKHGGDLWEAAGLYSVDPSIIMDFSACINPLGPSYSALRAIIRNLPMIARYPQAGDDILRAKLADRLGLPQSSLLTGNGSVELMYAARRLFDASRIVILAPSFTEYGRGLIDDVSVRLIFLDETKDFRLDIDQVDSVLASGDLLYLGNPNNPTGQLLSEPEINSIAQYAEERGANVIVDEAFIDFCGSQAYSARQLAASSDNLLVLGSLTKYYALPGLRIGYVVGSSQHMDELQRILPPWRVNCLASAAAAQSIEDQEFISETRLWFTKTRQTFPHDLADIEGLKVYPGQANYILVRCVGGSFNAIMLQDALGPQGILIRVCDDFPGLDSSYFRVAFRKEDDNRTLVNALKDAVKALKTSATPSGGRYRE